MAVEKAIQTAEAEAHATARAERSEAALANDLAPDSASSDPIDGAPSARGTQPQQPQQPQRTPPTYGSPYDARRAAIIGRFKEDRTADANSEDSAEADAQSIRDFTRHGMPPELMPLATDGDP